MSTNPFTHFVLVDFENRPDIELGLLAGHPVKVTLFLGLKSKLKSALVDQITTLPFEVRLVKIGMTKKNALDFVLTYQLGEMVAHYPRGHYYIVSGDKKDFEPLVTYLQANHVHVSRHEDIASLPFLQPLKIINPPPITAHIKPNQTSKATLPKSKPADNRRANVETRLKDSANRNRPVTRKRLHAYLKAALGKDTTDEQVENLKNELLSRKILTIADNGKVTYP